MVENTEVAVERRPWIHGSHGRGLGASVRSGVRFRNQRGGANQAANAIRAWNADPEERLDGVADDDALMAATKRSMGRSWMRSCPQPPEMVTGLRSVLRCPSTFGNPGSRWHTFRVDTHYPLRPRGSLRTFD